MAPQPPRSTDRDFPYWLVAGAAIAAAVAISIASSDLYAQIFTAVSRGIWITIWVTLIGFALASALGLGVLGFGAWHGPTMRL